MASAASDYERILRMILCDPDAGVLIERTPNGAIITVDTSWIPFTNEDADIIEAIRVEAVS